MIDLLASCTDRYRLGEILMRQPNAYRLVRYSSPTAMVAAVSEINTHGLPNTMCGEIYGRQLSVPKQMSSTATQPIKLPASVAVCLSVFEQCHSVSEST